MPYSIEDVPYVMYFEGSYALHGAFWHNNFGHEQSHGCVNLAPLDAKKIFFWTEPPAAPRLARRHRHARTSRGRASSSTSDEHDLTSQPGKP